MFRRSGPINPQTGQPSIASTATGSGAPAYRPQAPGGPARPAQDFAGSLRSWSDPTSPESLQRGAPAAFGPGQITPRRPVPAGSGLPDFVVTPYYNGGAQMYAPQFDTPFTNPIGAGVPVRSGNHSAYYGSALYEQGVIFWTNQYIPTSIPPSELQNADQLKAILADFEVLQSIQVAP